MVENQGWGVASGARSEQKLVRISYFRDSVADFDRLNLMNFIRFTGKYLYFLLNYLQLINKLQGMTKNRGRSWYSVVF
jgi:hypothetical protein